MDETKLQYLRYKNSFKKQCIFMIVANALALLTLIFLIFIPCFRISMKDDVTGMVFARYDFSLFDEIKLVLGNLGKSSEILLPIYQIFAIVMIGAGMALVAFGFVKNILNIVNLDSYALIAYDEIKTKADRRQRGVFRRFQASQMFFGGIVFEIIYIIFAKVLNPIHENEAVGSSSYIALMNGVSGAVSVVIIFAVAAIACMTYHAYMKKKIQTAILKEDYKIENETTTE